MKSNVTQGCTAKTLHNTLSDCAYLFKNLRFLTVTVSEIVEQLKKVHTITDNVLAHCV